MNAGMQLDLFVLAAPEVVDAESSKKSGWTAQFERADWVAPYDTNGGMKAGEVRSGWRCPDPDCGRVEPTAFTLNINHGFDPDMPGRQPWDGRCWKVRHLGVLQRMHRLVACTSKSVSS